MDKTEWLKKRQQGIGGSDAAAVIGKNPWFSNVDLWEVKTGRKSRPDVSNEKAVSYGIKAEPLLIELFRIDFPEYDVKHKDFNILKDKEYPFLIASLPLLVWRRGVFCFLLSIYKPPRHLLV